MLALQSKAATVLVLPWKDYQEKRYQKKKTSDLKTENKRLKMTLAVEELEVWPCCVPVL